MPHRPTSTYSIVARDPATGQLGVAVQSHWFSVGTVVPWAASGVGAVATQAQVEPGYGPRGLELMSDGLAAGTALAQLVHADAESAARQVAFVDASGGVAVHTGDRCIAEAGHLEEDTFCVQANMMARPTVWPAMADAYRSSRGDLVERMVAALLAAEAEGGDIRGRQSAALLVVAGEPTDRPWDDRLFDIRVEDHPAPLDELQRLIPLRRAYMDMAAGDDALGAGQVDTALERYSAAARLVPSNPEMTFWRAVTLAEVGRIEEALPDLAGLFEAEPAWRELVRRIAEAGLLEVDAATLERILSA